MDSVLENSMIVWFSFVFTATAWHMEVPGLQIASEMYPSHGNTGSKPHLHTLLHHAVMLYP